MVYKDSNNSLIHLAESRKMSFRQLPLSSKILILYSNMGKKKTLISLEEPGKYSESWEHPNGSL